MNWMNVTDFLLDIYSALSEFHILFSWKIFFVKFIYLIFRSFFPWTFFKERIWPTVCFIQQNYFPFHEFSKNIFRKINLFDFHEFFWHGLFFKKIFLAYCVLCKRIISRFTRFFKLWYFFFHCRLYHYEFCARIYEKTVSKYSNYEHIWFFWDH